MKPLITTTTLIGFLLIFRAQAFSQEGPSEYFPEYQIEEIGIPGEAERPLLPFVYNGYVYAFSVIKKKPVWRIFIGGDLINPFVVSEGRLFVYDIYNRLFGVDMVKRKILWKTDIKDEIRGRPCVYKHYVLVSTQKGNLVILSGESGQVLFEHPGSAGVIGGLNVFGNLAVVPYKNGKIMAFDVDTKREAWAFSAGGIISVSPVISDDQIFFGAWDETFYALDAFTGRPRWVNYVGEDVSRDFLVFRDVIILFLSKGEVLCLDHENGEIRWVKYFQNMEFNFNYFQAKGKFFLFTPEFIAVSPETGEILYTYRERAYNAFKEMLFDTMIAGEHALTDEEKSLLLSTAYFSVSGYPHMPPLAGEDAMVYFVTEDSYFYVYDMEKDFFIIKYKLT